jgi:hypothetical protein
MLGREERVGDKGVENGHEMRPLRSQQLADPCRAELAAAIEQSPQGECRLVACQVVAAEGAARRNFQYCEQVNRFSTPESRGLSYFLRGVEFGKFWYFRIVRHEILIQEIATCQMPISEQLPCSTGTLSNWSATPTPSYSIEA